METAVQLATAYKGWTLRRWTGWKSVLGKTVRTDDPWPTEPNCRVCGQQVLKGELVRRVQSSDDIHWLCAHPNDPTDHYVGQWLFDKQINGEWRYLYVSAPTSCCAKGEYQRGANFNTEHNRCVTDETTTEQREAYRAEALQHMYAVIDEFEAALENQKA